jgi:L-serine dehydratase
VTETELTEKLAKVLIDESLTAGQLTFGELGRIATQLGTGLGALAVAEAALAENLSESEVGRVIWSEFEHNLKALDRGLSSESRSFLFGRAASELAAFKEPLTGNRLLDKAVLYTLATQVGNHCLGLRPCAGTGDSCPYTGLARAMREEVSDQRTVVRALAAMLKLGVFFRTAKISTGCNLEGFGAGAAGTAAALGEVFGLTPAQTEKAVTLALSPTIGVPCTPRVLVPGLCAAHIGGAVVLGWTSVWLVRGSDLPVGPPVDQMLALAQAVHPISAKEIVPTVMKYMEPFFKTDERVEKYVSAEVTAAAGLRREAVTLEGFNQVKALSAKTGSILQPFGEAVVGGSSQAVGSPANAARLAHDLAKGRIKKITVELYPELFARRAINIPAILMCGVYGAATSDGPAYAQALERVWADGVAVEVRESKTYQRQKIVLEADEQGSMIESLNRGGGRLVLLEARPGLAEAKKAAARLGIVLVEA